MDKRGRIQLTAIAVLLLFAVIPSAAAADTQIERLEFRGVNESFNAQGVNFSVYGDSIQLSPKQVFAPDAIGEHVSVSGYQYQGGPTGDRVQWTGITFSTGVDYGSPAANDLLAWGAGGGADAGSKYPATFFQKGAFASQLARTSDVADVFQYDYTLQESGYNVSWNISATSHYEHLIIDYKLVFSNATTTETVETWQDVYSGEEPERVTFSADAEQVDASTLRQNLTYDNRFDGADHELLHFIFEENASIAEIGWNGLNHSAVNVSYRNVSWPELLAANISENLILDNLTDLQHTTYNVTFPADSRRTVAVTYDARSSAEDVRSVLPDRTYYAYIIGSGGAVQVDTGKDSGGVWTVVDEDRDGQLDDLFFRDDSDNTFKVLDVPTGTTSSTSLSSTDLAEHGDPFDYDGDGNQDEVVNANGQLAIHDLNADTTEQHYFTDSTIDNGAMSWNPLSAGVLDVTGDGNIDTIAYVNGTAKSVNTYDISADTWTRRTATGLSGSTSDLPAVTPVDPDRDGYREAFVYLTHTTPSEARLYNVEDGTDQRLYAAPDSISSAGDLDGDGHFDDVYLDDFNGRILDTSQNTTIKHNLDVFSPVQTVVYDGDGLRDDLVYEQGADDDIVAAVNLSALYEPVVADSVAPTTGVEARDADGTYNLTWNSSMQSFGEDSTDTYGIFYNTTAGDTHVADVNASEAHCAGSTTVCWYDVNLSATEEDVFLTVNATTSAGAVYEDTSNHSVLANSFPQITSAQFTDNRKTDTTRVTLDLDAAGEADLRNWSGPGTALTFSNATLELNVSLPVNGTVRVRDWLAAAGTHVVNLSETDTGLQPDDDATVDQQRTNQSVTIVNDGNTLDYNLTLNQTGSPVNYTWNGTIAAGSSVTRTGEWTFDHVDEDTPSRTFTDIVSDQEETVNVSQTYEVANSFPVPWMMVRFNVSHLLDKDAWSGDHDGVKKANVSRGESSMVTFVGTDTPLPEIAPPFCPSGYADFGDYCKKEESISDGMNYEYTQYLEPTTDDISHLNVTHWIPADRFNEWESRKNVNVSVNGTTAGLDAVVSLGGADVKITTDYGASSVHDDVLYETKVEYDAETASSGGGSGGGSSGDDEDDGPGATAYLDMDENYGIQPGSTGYGRLDIISNASRPVNATVVPQCSWVEVQGPDDSYGPSATYELPAADPFNELNDEVVAQLDRGLKMRLRASKVQSMDDTFNCPLLLTTTHGKDVVEDVTVQPRRSLREKTNDWFFDHFGVQVIQTVEIPSGECLAAQLQGKDRNCSAYLLTFPFPTIAGFVLLFFAAIAAFAAYLASKW